MMYFAVLALAAVAVAAPGGEWNSWGYSTCPTTTVYKTETSTEYKTQPCYPSTVTTTCYETKYETDYQTSYITKYETTTYTQECEKYYSTSKGWNGY